MENIHKKLLDQLFCAEKHWKNADHLICVIYPFVGDKRVLIKALDDTYKSVILVITTILQLEHLYKRICLTSDSRKNLRLFFSKCSRLCGLDELDLRKINEIITIGKKNQKSGFVFMRNGRIVVMDDNLGYFELSLQKLNEFHQLNKKLIKNSNYYFNEVYQKGI